MSRFFDYDNLLFRFLSKVADLIVLNVLFLLFSIPLVTIGASLTATHFAALKLRREEGHVLGNFWKSFRENFKQSTIIWLLYAIYMAIICSSWAMLSSAEETMGSIMQGTLLAAFVLSMSFALWVFPLQSKFVNPIKRTVRNAFIMIFKHILRTVFMLIVSVLPFLLSVKLLSLMLLLGFSVPIYVCAITYNKLFEKMEQQVLESIQEREEKI